MADIVNLQSESGRNIIGDDSTATLELENTSSGNVLKLQNAGGTGVQLSAISAPTTSIYVVGAKTGVEVQTDAVAGVFRSTASASNVLQVSKTILGSPTVALMNFGISTASAPALSFSGMCVQSTASATASLIAGIRVQFTDPAGLVRQGWIPVAVNIA